MIEKIKNLLGSIRFYMATFAWLADYLAKVSADGFDLVVLFQQIALWIGTVLAIGTADAIITKARE